MENCMVCGRIRLIREGRNPYFVRELNAELDRLPAP